MATTVTVITQDDTREFEAAGWMVHDDFQLDIIKEDETAAASFAPGWRSVFFTGSVIPDPSP